MKHLIILILFISALSTRNQGYETNYKADICDCIESKKNTFQNADKIYNACFSKHMTTYAAFIDAEIKEEDKTKKFITGQKVIRDLNQKFKYELVYSCDAYIDIIEGKKQDVIQQFRSKKTDSTRIDKLNETVAMQPHYANYFNRGQYYYYIGDLQKAERDVLKSIQENPLNEGNVVTAQENFLLALIYEEQKRYGEAIAIYDAINAKGINPSVEIMKAIVFRKSNGYVLKSKEVNENSKTSSVLAPKPNTKLRSSTRDRTSQRRNSKTNTPQVKTPQNRSITKKTDSTKTKSLHGLFKLD